MEQKNLKEVESIDNKGKEVEMAGRKGGLFGLVKIDTQRTYLNPIGFGLVVIGVYLLLVFFDIVPFTSRFEIFNNSSNVLLASIISFILGVILNDKIRNILQR